MKKKQFALLALLCSASLFAYPGMKKGERRGSDAMREICGSVTNSDEKIKCMLENKDTFKKKYIEAFDKRFEFLGQLQASCSSDLQGINSKGLGLRELYSKKNLTSTCKKFLDETKK